MSVGIAALIGAPLWFVAIAFFLVYRETLRIHKVVNSRLSAALGEIEKLQESLTELRSTPESRREAARKDPF